MPLFRKGDKAPFDIPIHNVVIAGWAARDPAAALAHIRELEEIGVPPPSSIPCFYRVAAANLTTAASIEVLGGATSGEVEIVLLAAADGLWVTVGSDHTDRQTEKYSVALSKQACAKPIASEVWRYEEVVGHWDRLELRSYAAVEGERRLYQEGGGASLLPPTELIGRYTGGSERLPAGTAMFCGTVAAIGGILISPDFELELRDPVLDRRICHTYVVTALPISG